MTLMGEWDANVERLIAMLDTNSETHSSAALSSVALFLAAPTKF